MKYFGLLVVLQAIYISSSLFIELDMTDKDENLFHTIDSSDRIKGIPSENVQQASSNVTDEIIEYLKHIKENTIKYTGKYVPKKANLTKSLIRKINYVTSHLLNYLSYANDTNIVTDKEFLLLNILERAYRLYVIEKRQILENTISEINCGNKMCIDMYLYENELIKNQSREFKTNELRYICKKYNVCKTFPALTDFFEDLLNEVLDLPDDRLKPFVEILTKIALNNNDFINMFSGVKDSWHIIGEVGAYYNKIGLKPLLIVIKNVINERYSIVSKPNYIPNQKVQAVRILVDIIDEKFQCNNIGKFYDYYEDTIKAIKRWGIGETALLKTILEKFLSNVFSTIAFNDHPMRIPLIEIIVRGKTEHEIANKKLFLPGSKGVY